MNKLREWIKHFREPHYVSLHEAKRAMWFARHAGMGNRWYDSCVCRKGWVIRMERLS